MEDTSLCDVLIELVDRYITEKQERLRYCSELVKNGITYHLVDDSPEEKNQRILSRLCYRR